MISYMHTSGIYARWIHRENVPLVWPMVRARLEQTIKDWANGECEIEDLYDSLICAKSQLWLVNDEKYNLRLVGITKILSYPRLKRILVDMIVGEGVKDALLLLPEVERWGLQFGATQTEVHVRPGLAKILEREGAFKKSRVVLFRELQNADISESQRKMGQKQT
jgi:hypothetical protein